VKLSAGFNEEMPDQSIQVSRDEADS